jgi:invasion protein IalB
MVLRVDWYEEIKAPYLRCTNAGCEVQVELTAELVAQLKEGLKLRVGIRPFGSSQTVVIDASLKGFARAFNRLM